MIGAVETASEVLGTRAERDVPIGELTTYRVGGAAALLVRVNGPDDLVLVAEAVRASGIEVLVIGNGSNLLVADRGFDGLALVLGDGFATIAVDGTTVRAGGGASLPVVARRTAAAALTGFEWAVGVPGSVGGAVRMNAGGHGSDMAATLVGVRRFDLQTGEDVLVRAADLDLRFRGSNITRHQLVVEAELRLGAGDRAASEAEISEIVRWRRDNQPGGANAGSVFVNPPGESAGRLVDVSGAKGRRRGTAAVSAKHANFIQADDGGSADDIFELMVEVQQLVKSHTGVLLRPETRLVGFRPSSLDLEHY